jgi:ribosomal protein S18 acetylase RimI-like enzyme
MDAILDVYRQCEDFLAMGPEPRASMTMVTSDIETSHRQGGIFCGIHTACGRMVGVVDFILRGFEGDPNVAYFSLLMLAASHRNRGLGTEIIELVEKEMADAYVKTILSSVQVNNPRALRFWQMNEYRIVGGPELQPDQTTVLHLRKDCTSVPRE